MKKLGILLVLVTVLLSCFACSVDPRDDSEMYSCYFYSVNGEDITSQMVYYTLELRTDGKLITRYKTKKNKDSGKDDYHIEGNTLVVSAYYGSKKFDIIANEIIMSDYTDSNTHVVARFRLTKTQTERTDTIYSCFERNDGENDLKSEMRYYIVSFEQNETFSLYYHFKIDGQNINAIYNGTYTQNEHGYLATSQPKEGETDTKTWQFNYKGDDLVLEEVFQGKEITSTFEKTHSVE